MQLKPIIKAPTPVGVNINDRLSPTDQQTQIANDANLAAQIQNEKQQRLTEALKRTGQPCGSDLQVATTEIPTNINHESDRRIERYEAIHFFWESRFNNSTIFM